MYLADHGVKLITVVTARPNLNSPEGPHQRPHAILVGPTPESRSVGRTLSDHFEVPAVVHFGLAPSPHRRSDSQAEVLTTISLDHRQASCRAESSAELAIGSSESIEHVSERLTDLGLDGAASVWFVVDPTLSCHVRNMLHLGSDLRPRTFANYCGPGVDAFQYRILSRNEAALQRLWLNGRLIATAHAGLAD